MKCTDPAAMSHDERLRELGELLAAGIQRFLAAECKAVPVAKNSPDDLDVPGDSEAQCVANSKEPE